METHQSKTPGALVLQRLPSVIARTGLSRTTVWRKVREKEFPAPVKIGERSVAWDARAVDEWIEKAIAASGIKEAA